IFVGDDGLTPDEHTALLQSAANLLIASGHVGRHNSGLVPVWPGANTQGAFDLGFSAAATRGMLAKMPAVLVVNGADVAFDPAWAAALEDTFVIYLGMFPGLMLEAADVVLPIQSFAERDGTFTNAMRRVQRFYVLHGPVGQSLPAWEAVAMLGEKLGGPKPRHSTALVTKAISESVALYTPMTLRALARVEPQLPPVGESPGFYGGAAKDPAGGTGLQWATAPEEGRAPAVKPVTVPEPVAAGEGELLISPVRRLYDRAPEFAASTLMHNRIPAPFAALNSADAEALGIADGDPISVTVGGSTLDVEAVVGSYAPQGVVLLPLRLSNAPQPFTPQAGTVAKAPVAEAVAGD
ncbi:MAG: molybdopterin-dependent oxidoreductase, partial [Anaerolineae bacterium]|nr:molybdopterin-dependent oxidoreductase [Anaerolineae bacterium]